MDSIKFWLQIAIALYIVLSLYLAISKRKLYLKKLFIYNVLTMFVLFLSILRFVELPWKIELERLSESLLLTLALSVLFLIVNQLALLLLDSRSK
ncbi:MAG: hypothetical protein CMO34_06310 [Verrucomicrobia bacterium]|nr:hypothetical protein [Verrucomicrobiota bacterium]